MIDTQTNLRVVRTSRKPLVVGDVFAMQLPNDMYLFGRVVLVEPSFPAAPGPCCNLVYIYAYQSSDKVPDLDHLSPDNLLIPPTWTNRLGWTHGVFETILNRPLGVGDMLNQHCFERSINGHLLNERGEPLTKRVEPCGVWGLVSYRYLDDRISEELGFPPLMY
ncbi:MAG: immunity 26/phosphotriesterase HocA family protein [Sphingomonadales bacterium]|nr:immunity 26/phosphotriesterase HocA family protein [Sphingomonadales bacterium]